MILEIFEELDEEFIPAEFDIFMREREKQDRIGNLKGGSKKIGNFDDPEVLACRTLDFGSSKRIHVRLYNFYNLITNKKSLGIFS